MQVGDLVRVAMAHRRYTTANPRIRYKGQLAVVIDTITNYNETMVKLISDGAELWFRTTELEAINESR